MENPAYRAPTPLLLTISRPTPKKVGIEVALPPSTAVCGEEEGWEKAGCTGVLVNTFLYVGSNSVPRRI